MFIVILPVSLSAEEGEEKTEEKDNFETEFEIEPEPESEASAHSEFKQSETTETTQSEKSQPHEQVNTGSISGVIWLDTSEDGVYDNDENRVAGYEVSLYLASDKINTIFTVMTDLDGKYMFEDIVPGDYVVGISLSQEESGIEYLLQLISICGDNKYTLDYSTLDEKAELSTQIIFTEVISIASDTQINGENGNMQSVPSIQPRAQVKHNYNNIQYTLDTETLTGTVTKYIGSGGQRVTIPAAVTYKSNSYNIIAIGEEAFVKSTITGVDIGRNVTSIGKYAFQQCTSMKGTLTIPSSVVTIEVGAFLNCTNLQLNYNSYIELVNVDVDTSKLGERELPKDEEIKALEKDLDEKYVDTKYDTYQSDKGKYDSYVFKSAKADEILINYAKACPGDYDFVLVIDESSSMQIPAAITLSGTNYNYPRYTYSHQILDQVSKQLLDTSSSLNNRLAVVGFGSDLLWSTADRLTDHDSGFTTKYKDVAGAIWDNLNLELGYTNYASGLKKAIDMIENRDDSTRIPVVIFISDGVPTEGKEGGEQAQTLRDMKVPVFPLSVFLSDSERAKAESALKAISYDRNTYYDARDADSFQQKISEVINDATSMTEIITDNLSKYFELSTEEDAYLYTESGTAYVDTDGSIKWILNGCEYGVNHTLKIKIKYTNEVVVGDPDNYETNEKLTVPDIKIESPEIPFGLESEKTVTDAGGEGIASSGEKLTYTISAKNTGKGDWVNERVRDELFNILPYIQEKDNLSGVSLMVNNDGNVTTDKTLQNLVDGFRINLAIGKSITITFNVTCINPLDSKTVKELENTATVGDTNSSALIPVGSVGSITINKSGDNKINLPGAVFLLEIRESGGTAWTPIKWNSTSQTWVEDTAKEGISTDNGGKIVFANLPLDSTYRITEIDAPNGYSLLKEPIEVTLPYEINQSSTEPAPDDYDFSKEYANGTTSYYYNNVTFTITDVSVLNLPNSGNDLTALMYILAGAGIALLGAGMYVIQRRHRAMIKR